MKNKSILAKCIAMTLSVCVLLGCAFMLFACNEDEPTAKSVSDIFKSTQSPKELTSAKREFTLPAGWSVYTSSATKSSQNADVNSDIGYIESIDAFVVNKGSVLSVVKCGDSRQYFESGLNGMLFPESLGISALRVKDGLIVCKFLNGECGAFNTNGETVLSRKKVGSSSTSSSKNAVDANIDVVLKILDGAMIAVNATYDTNGVSGYTSIYRPSTSGELSSRGELVCRLANTKALANVQGFDGKYVVVTSNSDGDFIYDIPQSANGKVENLTATDNGTVKDNGKDDYYSEITYLGNGRFFIHEDWTVNSTDEYLYYDGTDYYVFHRHIYTPSNDKLEEYTKNADKVFLYMESNYYDGSRGGISTKSYLQDGFIYASYGLNIINKVGIYDQFILDENLNVVMTLTGNYGISIDGQKKEKAGYFDLIMQCVDGYYYNPVSPSEINIYDVDGNKVGHNTISSIVKQELSNNVIIGAIKDPDDSSAYLYGAFNLYGERICEFNYLALSAFRGSYTIGKAKDEDNKTCYYIVGSDGRRVEQMSDGSTPLEDIATDSSKNPIYKIGCYMYKVASEDKDGTYRYGIKNFNPNVEKNVIMSATMISGSVLYAPSSSPSNVFVFSKIAGTNDSNATYEVYRLI